MLRLSHGFIRFSTLTRCFTAVARRPGLASGQHPINVVRCMSGGHDFKADKLVVKEQRTSLDDIPVPQGSFADYHTKRNTKWNLYLGASLALFGFTMYYMYKSGVWYLHGHPPMKNKRPEKEIEAVTASPLAASPPKKAEVKAPVAPPPVSVPLPEHVPYLIVGGGTTAFAAFRAIRSQEPTAKVLVISSESYAPYMRPPLSKEMWFTEDRDATKELKFTQWNGRERSLYFEKEAFYCQPSELTDKETGGVALALNRKVTRLDVQNQKAILEDGSEVKYDRCLIATGGRPKNLPVFEKAGSQVMRRVTLFRTVEDFHNLDATLNGAKSVAIVGGGFLGSELACALAKRGKATGLKVTQVFADIGNMGMVLPEYLSRWTTRKIEEEGAKVIPNAQVDSVTSQVDGRVSLRLSNGESVTVDHVVVAVGLEPNTELAESSGLELSSVHGGFLVNAELEARTNLWVAGDAACFYDTRLGRRRVEHHDHAVVSGRLAGENMTGAHKPYGHQSMFWSDLGPSIGYEAIGLVDSSLPTVAVFAKAEEKDTPKAVVEETGEGLRSETEQNAPHTAEKTSFHAPEEQENYGKGIVFYLRDNVVVGLVMWNVFNKMPIARKILKENVKEEEIAEISKLFHLYEKPVPNMP